MTITYRMKNATPQLVNTVMLRKFFQMVFVGQDRKSLHVYTASVIGGSKQDQINNSSERISFISHLDALKQFYMEFDFIITGNDNNDVESIMSEDITDGNGKGQFLSQIDYIQQVWGGNCEVIYNDQTKLQKKLTAYLEKVSHENNVSLDEKINNPDLQKTAALAQKKILWIEDHKKRSEFGMQAIAIPGKFRANNFDSNKSDMDIAKSQRSKVEGWERAAYFIKVPNEHDMVCGLELVNWVKTTIRFKYKLRDSNINFCIQKDSDSEERTTYYAPDFTWYFAPRVKSFINNESSSVEITSYDIKNKVYSCKHKKCLEKSCQDDFECNCPNRTQGIGHVTNRYANVINPVANKTTVNFKRWTDDEKISYRQKYRLASKNIFLNPQTFDIIKEINIFLDTTDEHARGNRQYVIGLFISFALAFGIDSSRLAAAADYFPFPLLFTADAWWLLFLILLSLNLLIWPPHSKHERCLSRWRIGNVLSSLVWTVMVFVVEKSEWLTSCFAQYRQEICLATQLLYCFIIISGIAYCLVNIVRYNDPVLTDIMGDGVL